MVVPYESHIVCQFFREWGRLEQLHGKISGPLIGNMQNWLDSIYGDVAAASNDSGRFALFEFKRARGGFAEEVAPGGKGHRRSLFEHLKQDAECSDLSRIGHIAAYHNGSGEIEFQPYVFAAIKGVERDHRVVQPDMSRHASPWNWWCSLGDIFHKINLILPLTTDELSVAYDRTEDSGESATFPFLYKNWDNVGLYKEDFADYLDCMYQHLPEEGGGLAVVVHTCGKAIMMTQIGMSDLRRELFAYLAANGKPVGTSHRRR